MGVPGPCLLYHLTPRQVYQGENHPTDALTKILDGIYYWSLREKIVLWNPSNLKECITDKWLEQPEMYDAFLDAVSR